MTAEKSDFKNLNVAFKVSKKVKRMRLTVFCDSRVVVTFPLGLSLFRVENFLAQKQSWILKKLQYFKAHPVSGAGQGSKKEYLAFKAQALLRLLPKVEYWNTKYNFQIRNISVKNQATRWGSCSKKKNLNFNYKTVFLPEPLLDYLVVHELCHLKEFNHSKNFWSLVAQTVPDYPAKKIALARWSKLETLV